MAQDAAPTPGQDQPAVKMQVLAQYIRDMSFENILVQKGIGSDVQPDVQVQVNLDANKKGDNTYEVAIKLRVDAKSTESQVFLLEVDYAGNFQIENIPEEQLHPFLMIECPRMLFPFIRQIARNMTADGGYPPINIDNIDFLTLYKNELARRAQEQGGSAQV